MSNTTIKDKASDRIRALRRVSQPTPEGGWITVEAEHQTDRPEGGTVEDTLRLEFEALARVTDQVSSLGPQSKPGPAKPVESARPVEQPKPQTTIVSALEAAVRKIPVNTGKANSKGGHWWFSDQPELADLVALLRQAPKKTLEVSGYRYTLSGEDDRFVNRWGIKK